MDSPRPRLHAVKNSTLHELWDTGLRCDTLSLLTCPSPHVHSSFKLARAHAPPPLHTHTHTHTQGIPLPVVFSLFDEGLRLCQPLFSSQATPIESLSLRPCKNDHSSSTSSVECRRSNEKSVWSHDTGNPPILKSVPSHDTSIPPKLKAGNYSKVKLYSRHLSSSQPPSHVTTPTTSHESHMTREALSLLR